jgi:hypothetical protein
VTNIDLNLAANYHGPLDGETRARLMAAVQEPGEATWDDAYSIILNREAGLGLTLWQAVLEVDPGFAGARAPVRRLVEGHSELMSGWSQVPPADVIAQAINYATR